MRLFLKFTDGKEALAFSDWLKDHKIDCQVDDIQSNDWGKTSFGDREWLLWIVQEDDVDQAKKLWQEWQSGASKKEHIENFLEGLPKGQDIRANETLPKPRAFRHRPFWTRAILILCILFFIISIDFGGETTGRSWAYKTFLYDYPKAFQIIDQFLEIFGKSGLEHPSALPLAGQQLLEEYVKTPFWQGFYHWFLTGDAQTFQAPLFEKIRQGEVWRLITPAFLHQGLIHIFFNMMWLLVLGFQMEMRLGAKRYLAFVLLTAVFTSTCQYLMSGPNFVGFSGVLAAMLGFILTRMEVAPHERYRLDKKTGRTLLYFLLAVAALGILLFFLEWMFQFSIPFGIANTAHLSGLLIGALLALTPWFS